MDAYLQIIIFLLVGFSVVFCELRTTNLRKVTSQSDRILLNGSLAAIDSRSKISCMNQCSLANSCMSMIYKSDTKQCILHEFLGAYLELQQSIMTQFSGWKYYEKVRGPAMPTRIWECLSSGFLYDPVVDSCYIIQTMDFDFELINQHCADLNSGLIKITSQEKQDWIISKLTTNTPDWICIQGNNDNKVEYQFDDGTPMTYFNWNTPEGQPDGGVEHYINILMSKSYKWHDSRAVYAGLQCLIVCEK